MAIVEIPVTLSGSIVTAEDASARDAIALTVNIDPVQNLHGQTAPYPATLSLMAGTNNVWALT